MAVDIRQFGRTTSSGVVPRGEGWERFGQGGFVRLTGFEAMQTYFAKLSAGSITAAHLRLVFGSDVFYSPFVNWGTRYMQGRFFLQAAQYAAKQSLRRNLPRALPQGPAAVVAAFEAAGDAGEKAMYPIVPVRSGRLRREQKARLFGSRG